MNVIESNIKCAGCGACVDACPNGALCLTHSENGFYVPKFANNNCINCGKCNKVCPTLDIEDRTTDTDFFYGWINDNNIRSCSSSGGAFSALAQSVINGGGVVFGAAYANNFKSIPMLSTEQCSLEDLRRSKYCQAYPNNMYKKANKALKGGKQVMMVGTPCQITAAKKLLGDNKNLLLVDFICGGVTPDTAFAEYVEYLEKKYNSKIKSINMRDKSAGWTSPKMVIDFKNGKRYSSRYQFDYYYYYYYMRSANLKNEVCLTCPFIKHTYADISIADFWGYRTEKIENDQKGMSLICAYTDKGKAFLNKVAPNMQLFPLEKSKAEYVYKEKNHTKEALNEREWFLSKVKEKGFIKAAKQHKFKYGKSGVFLGIIFNKVKHK